MGSARLKTVGAGGNQRYSRRQTDRSETSRWGATMIDRRCVWLGVCWWVVAGTALAQATAEPRSELPKVVLVGDSIRLGYAPLVAKRLAGKATVVSVTGNGGDSANVLKNLDEWIVREKPVVVHLNCGLHDLKLSKTTKKHQVEAERYEANLKEIVTRIRKDTSAALVFANTTPILDDRHAKRGGDF